MYATKWHSEWYSVVPGKCKSTRWRTVILESNFNIIGFLVPSFFNSTVSQENTLRDYVYFNLTLFFHVALLLRKVILIEFQVI